MASTLREEPPPSSRRSSRRLWPSPGPTANAGDEAALPAGTPAPAPSPGDRRRGPGLDRGPSRNPRAASFSGTKGGRPLQAGPPPTRPPRCSPGGSPPDGTPFGAGTRGPADSGPVRRGRDARRHLPGDPPAATDIDPAGGPGEPGSAAPVRRIRARPRERGHRRSRSSPPDRFHRGQPSRCLRDRQGPRLRAGRTRRRHRPRRHHP
jgi:hypothetical protein